MSQTSHLEDIDHLVALHLGLDNETGTVIAGYERPLSNAKVDVTFHGESAHAGKAPNEGKNALQAATTAIQNLYAIPHHLEGATRFNDVIADPRVASSRGRCPLEIDSAEYIGSARTGP